MSNFCPKMMLTNLPPYSHALEQVFLPQLSHCRSASHLARLPGSRVSDHTLSAYRHAVGALLIDWSEESLLRPGRCE